MAGRRLSAPRADVLAKYAPGVGDVPEQPEDGEGGGMVAAAESKRDIAIAAVHTAIATAAYTAIATAIASSTAATRSRLHSMHVKWWQV